MASASHGATGAVAALASQHVSGGFECPEVNDKSDLPVLGCRLAGSATALEPHYNGR